MGPNRYTRLFWYSGSVAGPLCFYCLVKAAGRYLGDSLRSSIQPCMMSHFMHLICSLNIPILCWHTIMKHVVALLHWRGKSLRDWVAHWMNETKPAAFSFSQPSLLVFRCNQPTTTGQSTFYLNRPGCWTWAYLSENYGKMYIIRCYKRKYNDTYLTLITIVNTTFPGKAYLRFGCIRHIHTNQIPIKAVSRSCW